MRTVAFYHRQTGEFHHIIVTCNSKAAVEQNTPPDHIVLDHESGAIHPQRHRFDIATSTVIDSARPSVLPDRPKPHALSIQERLTAVEDELAKGRDAK